MKTFIVMLWLLSSVQLTELGEAEEAKVNYGNDAAIQYSMGEFSIDFVSSLDFGTNEISNQNQVYFAQAQRYYKSTLVTPNFIQITDNRGTLKGWTLKVYEKEQFKAEEYSQYQELKGAALSFHKPILVTNNNAQQPQAYEVGNLVPGVETLVAQAKVGEIRKISFQESFLRVLKISKNISLHPLVFMFQAIHQKRLQLIAQT